jgi:hypothetical protein
MTTFIRATAVFVLMAVVLVAPSARAGSYLERAALLLEASRAERDRAKTRPNDRELMELVHAIARARNDAGRRMQVPTAIEDAHPHLLLVLENTERAFAAALDRHFEKFAEFIERARTEDRTFRALVSKMGYTLPTP